MFLAAGKLLRDFLVTDDSWYEADPWREWLSRYILTRADDRWLSDGTDWMPVETTVNLQERKGGKAAITGDKKKLLALVNAVAGSKKLVVNGTWYFWDSIRVRVSSALAPPDEVKKLASRLVKEQPMFAYLPSFDHSHEDDEADRNEKRPFEPWIVTTSRETRLDRHDPIGVSDANTRARLAREFEEYLRLSKADTFGRCWLSKDGKKTVEVGAWGRDSDDDDRTGRARPGMRLLMTQEAIKKVLKWKDRSLVVLISLELYESGYRTESNFTHTIGVLCVSKDGTFRYVPGRVNYLHKSQLGSGVVQKTRGQRRKRSGRTRKTKRAG